MTKTPVYLIATLSSFLEKLELKLIDQAAWDHLHTVSKMTPGEDLPDFPDHMVADYAAHYDVPQDEAMEELTELFSDLQGTEVLMSVAVQNICPSQIAGESFFVSTLAVNELQAFTEAHNLQIVQTLQIFL